MNYFTGIATDSVFEFPYSGHQTHLMPSANNDVDAILASIAPSSSIQMYNQTPSITLQCVPQINTAIGNNTLVYQVPENVPLDVILQQLGVNPNSLQPSGIMSNYYRTAAQPMELLLPPSSSHRPRRLVCREVSDSDEDDYLRRPSSHHGRRRHSHLRGDSPQQSPVALHDILNRVWGRAERQSGNLPPSSSVPDFNSPMRNRSTPPISSDHQGAINNVWRRADNASRLGSNRPSQPFPSPNREAVNNFFAAGNAPFGANTGPPSSSAAVNNFHAARNTPFGANTGSTQSNPAVNNFLAARNTPFGANTGPTQSNPAVNNFLAARNTPFGANTGPPPSNSAVNNFFGARDAPFSANTGSPSFSSPSMNNMWSRLQQDAPSSLNPPIGGLQRNPGRNPAPVSFAALLSQAHRQRLPYAGAA